MRASDFITEIESLGKIDGTGWIPDRSLKGRLTPIKSHPGLFYKTFQRKIDTGPKIYIYNPSAIKQKPKREDWMFDIDYQKRIDQWKENSKGIIVGSLETMATNMFPIPNSVKVSTIVVHPDYRGQGLAQVMYDILINKLKKVLVAGDSQTPDGQRAWLNLAKNPNVNVNGYYSVSDNAIKRNPSLIDDIMNLGGQQLGEPANTEYGNYYFFEFPLKFGIKRLNPVVLNKLSQIYGDDTFGTGMYAVGTQQ